MGDPVSAEAQASILNRASSGDFGWLWELLTTNGIKIIGVLALFIIGLIVAKWMSRLTAKGLEARKFDTTLTKFFANMVRYVVLTLVILMCLGAFGADVTSFAAIFVAAGFAVGLALQGSLSNFAAGVMLLAFRPYKVGDVVSVAGVTAKVDEIQLFTTTLDTPDNRRIIAPNSQIFGAVIENITFHSERRVDVNVGVEYSADIDQTREVLNKAAASVEGQVREHQVVLAGLGASSVDWQVRIWSPTADFFAIKEATTRAVKKALDEAGIGIPFPQMDVHLDKIEVSQSD